MVPETKSKANLISTAPRPSLPRVLAFTDFDDDDDDDRYADL